MFTKKTNLHTHQGTCKTFVSNRNLRQFLTIRILHFLFNGSTKHAVGKFMLFFFLAGKRIFLNSLAVCGPYEDINKLHLKIQNSFYVYAHICPAQPFTLNYVFFFLQRLRQITLFFFVICIPALHRHGILTASHGEP